MTTEIQTTTEQMGLTGAVSPALMIMLDDKLFERTKMMAKYMASAEGFTPGHLIGKTEACFAVISRALTWKLDPFAVAQATYSPAPGKVGFEGKLCQAIIENSGMVQGGVKFIEVGDWTKVAGKFTIAKSAKGKDYPKATYTEKDEDGVGIIAQAQVKGEAEPREYKIMLRQAYPRNSTLWATDPRTQLCYRAARGLGNLAMPGIFMGVPFVGDDAPDMVDITPKESPSETIAKMVDKKIEDAEIVDVVEEKEPEDSTSPPAETHIEAEQTPQPKQEQPALDITPAEASEALKNVVTWSDKDVSSIQGVTKVYKELVTLLGQQTDVEQRIAIYDASNGRDLLTILNEKNMPSAAQKLLDAAQGA